MSITSIIFLFCFLPLSLTIFYLANDRAKEYILVVFSLIFYALGSLEYLTLFIVAIVFDVIFGRQIAKTNSVTIKKLLFILGVVTNTGILVYYKYTDFILLTWGNITSTDVQLKGILLPLGISFFTFKAISYLADIYTGKAILNENPIHDVLYLSFFAQIQSGPLSRYNGMAGTEDKNERNELFANGVYRFIIGFNKKILLANVLVNITNEVFATPFENMSTGFAWLGSICYSMQLFFDFAGYSDMAIGISEMFGYRCMENFNFPYMTESVAKFWRRWHISLSEWFRDYIYIPLGGSKNKKRWKVYFNLFVVWSLTGIWHGASWNFVAWGLGYFVLISFERLTKLPERLKTRIGKLIYRIFSLLFINFQWVLFRANNLKSGLFYINRMIIPYRNNLSDTRALFLLKDYSFFIAMSVLLCFPIVDYADTRLRERKVLHVAYEILFTITIISAFVWAISFVVSGQNNPFAYANF